MPPSARLQDIGDAAGWRCWLCDEPGDPDTSVNNARGRGVDAIQTAGVGERYDFNWSDLRDQENPFARFDYDRA